MEQYSQQLEILVVDDSPGDVGLLEAAFQHWRVQSNVNVVEDGEQALQYLKKEPPYESVPVPDLIFLDLNLPKKDGRATLAEIKADQELKHIPVIILSTSDSNRDILDSYKLHANCYMTKPLHIDEFFQKIQLVEDFWLSTVRLPNLSLKR